MKVKTKPSGTQTLLLLSIQTGSIGAEALRKHLKMAVISSASRETTVFEENDQVGACLGFKTVPEKVP